MSKKLAEGIDALVLDVKVGSGAFMKDFKSARQLAETLCEIGRRAGKKVTASQIQVGTGTSPREILQVRYVQGEITREQYQPMLADLS